jgi:hypothetical protein
MAQRFDLKDLSIYVHDSLESSSGKLMIRQIVGGIAHMMTNTMHKEAKNIGVWINKCGGKRKFAVEEGVNVAIIEMARISSIIHSFISWRLKNYQKCCSIER